MRGFVYVLSNKAMPGLVKVGYTTRSMIERLNELNATGVPTSFISEFYFEVNNAPLGEKLLHRALRNYHFEKEFFKVSVSNAVKCSKELIEKNELVVYGIHGRAKELHLTATEQESIRKLSELQKIKEKEIQEQQIKIIHETHALSPKFFSLCPSVNNILKTKSILGSGSGLRHLVAGALGATLIFGALADEISPTSFDDGLKVALKLTESEKKIIKDFHACVKKLIDLNAFSNLANEWSTKASPNDFLTSSYSGHKAELSNSRETSSLLKGVFKGLGLIII